MKVTLWRKNGYEFICSLEGVEGPLGDLHIPLEDDQLMVLVDMVTNSLVWKEDNAQEDS